jgi:hypothetical protein
VNVTEDRRITEFDFGNLKRRVTNLSEFLKEPQEGPFAEADFGSLVGLLVVKVEDGFRVGFLRR